MNPVLWPTYGWTESTPEAQGLNPDALLEAVKFIRSSQPNVYSLLIVRNGQLVFEKYFQNSSPKTLHRVASVTRSVLSILVGIALKEGAIPSLEQSIVDYFPELQHQTKSSVKDYLTLRLFLTMREGHLFNEDFEDWANKKDQTQFALDLPSSIEPGADFMYTGAAHLISRIINLSTGSNAADYAKERLFQPLGIRDFEWPVDATGTAWGSGGLRLTSRDMAKLGYLYLNNGMWEGRSIVTPDWVEESTKNQNKSGPPYGYYWWVGTRGGHPFYGAVGFGGQHIFVFPKLELILVTTAEVGGPGTGGIVEKFILPAVL